MQRISLTPHGSVLIIELNRPDKRNAFDLLMLQELAEAFTRYEDDPALHCALLCAAGDHFTAGLDLADVAPAIGTDQIVPAGKVDPLGLRGRCRTKPLVTVAHGWSITMGVELLLASDIGLCADNTRFAQLEIKHSLIPLGGATFRLPQRAGWGNAMRWLLTGETFDAHEAKRLGLVEQVVPLAEARSRALAIAETIASYSPVAVRAILTSAHTRHAPIDASVAVLDHLAQEVLATDAVQQSLQAFGAGTFTRQSTST